MGEAQRLKELEEVIARLARRLTDEGRLIEGGWVSFRGLAVPTNASEIQVSQMRIAFFCGAHFLFTSLLTFLEPGAEATTADVNRMSIVAQELEAFRMVATAPHPPGRA